MAERTDLTAELASRAKDAVYVAVGLGVLGFQRLQVRRNDLMQRVGGDPRPTSVEEKAGDLRAAVGTGIAQLDEWIDATLTLVETALAPVEESLPIPAHELVAKGRELKTQLRQLVDTVV